MNDEKMMEMMKKAGFDQKILTDKDLMESFKNLKMSAMDFANMMMKKGMNEGQIMDTMKKMSDMMMSKDMMTEKW